MDLQTDVKCSKDIMQRRVILHG